jgi:hypothetical protein
MRLKLLFEDELNPEFAKSWYYVHESAKLVSDISYSVSIFLFPFDLLFPISSSPPLSHFHPPSIPSTLSPNYYLPFTPIFPLIQSTKANIWKDFSLKSIAPSGVVLIKEDFAIPPNQTLAILSEGDTITYVFEKRRKSEGWGMGG